MKQTIRNPRRERRAIREAQAAMDRRPGVSAECLLGLANAVLIMGLVIGFGVLAFFAFGGEIQCRG